VSFTGFLNQGEIAKAYVAADALVLPSDYGETWGLVVNEAMACGLPAIVSDRVGCGPDLVVPGVTGQVFPFGEVEGLAGIFAEWAASPQSVREMGRAAERRVRDEYTVQAATDGVAAAAFSLARPPGLRSAKSSWQSQPAEQD
jgi:glycosyltransferase involved in cell wall biosynthesis